MRTLGTRWLCGGVVLAMTVFAGCGSGGGTPHVASVNGGTNDTTPKASKGKTDPKQAMLAFAKCMREHGVDMPDPQFNDDGRGGGFTIQGPSGGGPDKSAKTDAASKACEPLMDDVVRNGPDKLDPEQEAKMRRQALAFAKCMRKHGIDMPDPQFGDDGRNTVKIGSAAGQKTVGNGPDPRNAKFQAAAKVCQKGSGMRAGFGSVRSAGR